MKPILFRGSETTFDTNGIGVLSDVIECPILQQLNGQYELTMRYPVTGVHYEDLIRRAIILVKPDQVSRPQPFRIYRRVPSSKGTITVYARHLAYDLSGVVVSPFSATGAASTMLALPQNAVNGCPFTFVTDKGASGTFTVAAPSAIWTLLGGSEGSVLDVYGGEYEFDRWTVNLWNRRGADRGVSIRYGKNLTSLEQDENCANCFTAVYPYWLSMDGQLVQLPEKIVNASGTYDHERIMPLDLSQEWQEAPTEEQLRQRAEKYIRDNDIGVPTVSWKISYVDLEQTEEYKGKALLERVLLGDTVSVEFPQMGVSASARVVEVEYDPILERYNSITLGSVKSNIADTIVEQKKETAKKPSVSLVQSIVMTLTASILGAKGGAVRLLDTDSDGMPDTLYVADNADPAKAVKVWRWNYEGWAGSKTGYNGPFNLGATLEDGLLAEAVTAAHLVAGTIQSQDGKSFYMNLDTGEVKIQAVDILTESVGKQIVDVQQNAEQFTVTAMKDYVKQSDYDGFMKSVSTQLQTLAEGLQIKVSTEAMTGINDSLDGLREQVKKLTTYFRFESDGQYIGRSDSEMQTRFANNIWEFLLNGIQQLYIDPNGVHGKEIYTDSIHIGNLVIQAQTDGSVVIS